MRSAIAQPVADRNHRPSRKRQHAHDEGREQKDALVGAVRDDRLLEDELQHVGEALPKAEGTDHIGTAPQLHGGPNLAVRVEDVGDEDQQDRRAARRF